MKDQYVLEWSQQQNAFHIQTLDNLLKTNAKCFAANKAHQYMTLLIGSEDECSKAANELRDTLKVRELLRHAA